MKWVVHSCMAAKFIYSCIYLFIYLFIYLLNFLVLLMLCYFLLLSDYQYLPISIIIIYVMFPLGTIYLKTRGFQLKNGTFNLFGWQNTHTLE